jgi:hypothetical protein
MLNFIRQRFIEEISPFSNNSGVINIARLYKRIGFKEFELGKVVLSYRKNVKYPAALIIYNVINFLFLQISQTIRYSYSKLCQVLNTRYLAKLVKSSGTLRLETKVLIHIHLPT